MTVSKEQAIEQLVRQAFSRFPEDVYSGALFTDEVIEEVRLGITRNGWNFTKSNASLTYEWICELGPCGENDRAWLKRWGKGVA